MVEAAYKKPLLIKEQESGREAENTSTEPGLKVVEEAVAIPQLASNHADLNSNLELQEVLVQYAGGISEPVMAPEEGEFTETMGPDYSAVNEASDKLATQAR